MSCTFPGLRVLIVEDDALQRRVLCARVADIGVAAVLSASDGHDALRVIAENPSVNVIISDLDMPGMDGLELVRQLARRGSRAAVALHSAMDPELLACAELMVREHQLKFLSILEKPAAELGIRRILARACRTLSTKTRAPRAAIAEGDVHAALESGAFVPYFQPQVRFADGRVVAAEALARWPQPGGGFIGPDAFIPVLESAGLMPAFTWLMFDKVLAATAAWQRAFPGVHVAVNLSLSFLARDAVAEQVTALCERHGVARASVVLEITETVSMTDVATCLENIARLRMHGFTLSIDDFGTGYSSLLQLVRVPSQEIKLDRSFVAGVIPGSRAALLLEATIDMARKLRMTSVGEGVENHAEWAFLEGIGCDVAQGYFIARPMAEADFARWLEDHGGVWRLPPEPGAEPEPQIACLERAR